MLAITARNVNDAYHEGLWRMHISGVEADSRNGKVKRIPGPVATTYKHPIERMLFDAKRDANPFFHIMEGIWMLAGRHDVAFVSQFNSNIGQFSDNGRYFNGSYGYRWRKHWAEDQLAWVIDHLRKEPGSRRAVLQMYDPSADQEPCGWPSKDVPCNTAAYFDIMEGHLSMTVTCRSNDMIWGCYGANAVHFSMLMEFVAEALGVEMGQYVQFSNNFHVYERHFELLGTTSELPVYPKNILGTNIPITSEKYWKSDLLQFEQFCDNPMAEYDSPYVALVVQPMYRAWAAYKNGDKLGASAECAKIVNYDISKACVEWLGRRSWK